MKELQDTPGSMHRPEESDQHEIVIPEGMEQRLNALVDQLEAEEEQQRYKRNKRINIRAIGLGIAAVFVAAAFMLLTPRQSGRVIEVDDPEEARIQTERALSMLATTLNKGVKGIEEAEKRTSQVMGVLNK